MTLASYLIARDILLVRLFMRPNSLASSIEKCDHKISFVIKQDASVAKRRVFFPPNAVVQCAYAHV